MKTKTYLRILIVLAVLLTAVFMFGNSEVQAVGEPIEIVNPIVDEPLIHTEFGGDVDSSYYGVYIDDWKMYEITKSASFPSVESGWVYQEVKIMLPTGANEAFSGSTDLDAYDGLDGNYYFDYKVKLFKKTIATRADTYYNEELNVTFKNSGTDVSTHTYNLSGSWWGNQLYCIKTAFIADASNSPLLSIMEIAGGASSHILANSYSTENDYSNTYLYIGYETKVADTLKSEVGTFVYDGVRSYKLYDNPVASAHFYKIKLSDFLNIMKENSKDFYIELIDSSNGKMVYRNILVRTMG